MPQLQAPSMQAALPVSRHAPGRSGYRLCQRVVLRRSKDRAVGVLLRGVVPEPILTRLEAGYDGVARRLCVSRSVLRGRAVAAADVTALSAAPQVEPPAAGRQALHAAGHRSAGSSDRSRVGPASGVASLELDGWPPVFVTLPAYDDHASCRAGAGGHSHTGRRRARFRLRPGSASPSARPRAGRPGRAAPLLIASIN